MLADPWPMNTLIAAHNRYSAHNKGAPSSASIKASWQSGRSVNMSVNHVENLIGIKLIRVDTKEWNARFEGKQTPFTPPQELDSEGLLMPEGWLIRFVNPGSFYPNGDPAASGLWDGAPPVTDTAWKEGEMGISGGEFVANTYTPSMPQQYDIRKTFIQTDKNREVSTIPGEPAISFETYLIEYQNPVFAAINKRVVK